MLRGFSDFWPNIDRDEKRWCLSKFNTILAQVKGYNEVGGGDWWWG
jgi:hypothetical protein